jgi:hypothetical protein
VAGSWVGRGCWSWRRKSREATLENGARSTSTNQLTSSRPKGGQHDTNTEEDCRDGGAARSCGGDPHDQPPPENHVRRVSNNARIPEGFCDNLFPPSFGKTEFTRELD